MAAPFWPHRSSRFVARNLNTGRSIAERVTGATGRLERAVGLLARRGLESGEALWIMPSRGVHTWGMRFTIDLVALNADGVVVDLVEGLKPWRLRLPRRGTAGVLELPEGSLRNSGTRLGHTVTFELAADAVHQCHAVEG